MSLFEPFWYVNVLGLYFSLLGMPMGANFTWAIYDLYFPRGITRLCQSCSNPGGFKYHHSLCLRLYIIRAESLGKLYVYPGIYTKYQQLSCVIHPGIMPGAHTFSCFSLLLLVPTRARHIFRTVHNITASHYCQVLKYQSPVPADQKWVEIISREGCGGCSIHFTVLDYSLENFMRLFFH